VAVTVETVVARSVPDGFDAVGAVRAWKQSVLSAKTVATVVGVHAVEGQAVRTGQILVTLDDRDTRAQLRRAEAARDEARQALEEAERALLASERGQEAARAQQELAGSTARRYRMLLDRELIAAQDHEEVATRARVATSEAARLVEAHASLAARRRQALARIEQAEAEVAAATLVMGYTRIEAPFDGVVVARSVEPGNVAAPGVPLLTIDEQRYRLEASVEESQIRRVRVGQRAVVAIDALGAERPATVVEIVPTADPASRTFIVKIALPPAPGLRSGLYGRARFEEGARPVLTVPRAALVARGQLQRLFIAGPDGRARLRLVTTGTTLGDRVEVLSGLDAGEHVVIEGAAGLTDGEAVAPRG
jgi:multidrug efflux pump subunit AcrA (membrane-fusion protein)